MFPVASTQYNRHQSRQQREWRKFQEKDIKTKKGKGSEQGATKPRGRWAQRSSRCRPQGPQGQAALCRHTQHFQQPWALTAPCSISSWALVSKKKEAEKPRYEEPTDHRNGKWQGQKAGTWRQAGPCAGGWGGPGWEGHSTELIRTASRDRSTLIDFHKSTSKL